MNIVSINARGVAKKKKSIEEILNNESVDIAIISELSVKTLLGLKGYKEFIEIRGAIIKIKRKNLGKIPK